jgi:hypothetical protein
VQKRRLLFIIVQLAINGRKGGWGICNSNLITIQNNRITVENVEKLQP